MTPPRILVVDDEPSLLLTLAANLELEGFDVATAEGGPQALALVRQQPFDLVLSDVRMPGMNGVELFREIRKLCPNQPVILITAYAVETLLDEAIGEGAFTILPKFLDVETLLQLLTRAARAPAVLIADGARESAESAAAALQAMGIKARAAADEQSVVEALKGEAIDLCILDLDLAGGGDPPFIDRLRSLDLSLSFIVLKTSGDQELISKVAAGGTVDWVRRPVTPQALSRLIASARGRLPRAGGPR